MTDFQELKELRVSLVSTETATSKMYRLLVLEGPPDAVAIVNEWVGNMRSSKVLFSCNDLRSVGMAAPDEGEKPTIVTRPIPTTPAGATTAFPPLEPAP